MPLRLYTNADHLLEAFQIAARALPSRSALPSLTGIMIEADEAGAWLVSTDLELSLRVRLVAEVAENGRTVVPGPPTLDIVRHLPDAAVELQEVGGQLFLRYGRGENVLATYEADQFPSFPPLEGGCPVKLGADDWQGLTKQVLVACGTDEVQPVFTGVLWELPAGGPLTLVATDTHRLAVWRRSVEAERGASPVRVTVPRKALELSARIAQNSKEELVVELGSQQVSVRGADFLLVSRVIEAKYPNYEAVLPKSTATTVRVRREDFIDALQRASVLAREEDKTRANVVKLEIGEGVLTVSSRGSIGSMREPLDAEVRGKTGDMHFNVRYLLDGLEALSGEQAVIKINPDFSAAVIQNEGDESYLYLVLPVIVGPEASR